jgi:hypothetical protein
MKSIRYLAAVPLTLGLLFVGSGAGHAVAAPEQVSALSYDLQLYGYHCLTAVPCTRSSGGPMEYGDAEVQGTPGQRTGTPQYGYFDCTEYYTHNGTRYADEATFEPFFGPVSGQAGVLSGDQTVGQSEANPRAAGFMNVDAQDLGTDGTWTASGATVANNSSDTLDSGQYRITGKNVRIVRDVWNGSYFQYQYSYSGNVSCLAKAPADTAENELE